MELTEPISLIQLVYEVSLVIEGKFYLPFFDKAISSLSTLHKQHSNHENQNRNVILVFGKIVYSRRNLFEFPGQLN